MALLAMPSLRHWNMPQLWRNDEEMAKKNDDPQASRHSRRAHVSWAPSRTPRRTSILRLVAYVFIVGALGDLAFRLIRLDRGLWRLPHGPDYVNDEPFDFSRMPPSPYPPPAPSKSKSESIWSLSTPFKASRAHGGADLRRDYNGPLQFLNLANTLRILAATGGASKRNQNVLFAAATLKSAGALLPMACQMALQRENHVHFALMGRSDIGIEELLKINGIDTSCSLMVHDARPDRAPTSTEGRLALAVERALVTIHHFMRPQAIVVDSTQAEEDFFLRGMREQAGKTQSALIELPKDAGKRLSWISKLDASSLAAWNKIRFDIIVHSPSVGTGNLKRLLQSVARADLAGHQVPHLIVELPASVEPPLEKFLAGYRWPPPTAGEPPAISMLSLRRRIPRQVLTEEERSVRFMESFWPPDASDSHVLYLSPHMEISTCFFHYVKYSILLHLRSKLASRDGFTSKIMGLAFSIPATSVDGTEPFAPPLPLQANEPKRGERGFLWQAPTSHAILFLGKRWVELHEYVSQVFLKQDVMATRPAMPAKKEVSRKFPAWMEYALQLSRLRGYLILYPSEDTARAIATAHSDLADKPEEFKKQQGGGRDRTRELAGDAAAGAAFDAGAQVDVLGAWAEGGSQHGLSELPILSWQGKQSSVGVLGREAREFALTFRREVGQCTDEDIKARISAAEGQARDLFC